jgi:DNA-binding NarL/FixJ family response regulator
MTTASDSTLVPTSGLVAAPGWETARAAGLPAAPFSVQFPSRFDQSPLDGATVSDILQNARAALREAAMAAAEAAARARSLAEDLDLTLAGLTAGDILQVTEHLNSGESLREAIALSPREREVLALVAEGRTNKAIADALFVSPNTVKTHVTSLLHKLHADTRVQLAAIATRHELHPGATAGAH